MAASELVEALEAIDLADHPGGIHVTVDGATYTYDQT